MTDSNKLEAFSLWLLAYWAAFKADVREGFVCGRFEGFDALTAPDRGQMGAGNLIGLIIGISVAVIVGIGVGVPITNQVINQSNLSGISALIAGFIPVMLTLMIFVATASPIMART